MPNPLQHFHPTLANWFSQSFEAPTRAQTLAWPAIAKGENTLLLAPTGSGKTLAAFLTAIDLLMFPRQETTQSDGVKVLYISPLKALGADVERNLRAPLAGIRVAAERAGIPHKVPQVAIRSGDTPPRERQRISKQPPDILITTPESLYLMLTSKTRTVLQSVQVVIIDEIHAIVPTKRGTHLVLSLERLEALRRKSDPEGTPMQRIGLSATQKPLEEVAALLAGAEVKGDLVTKRPITIVRAGRFRPLEIRVEMPAEDGIQEEAFPTGPTSAAPSKPQVWPAIHDRLIALIGEHSSTIVFVNSRRLAERLATAINEKTESIIALAHHGSISKEARLNAEDRLKRGTLPAIIATSSLELGIDMGAVDLVVQIEAPPSIASGIQRIGRAGHQVGGTSKGVIFPKYQADLLACAAAVARMREGDVESRYYPRNALDVLAQQIVAIVAMDEMLVDELFDLVRQAAPFADLPRSAFDNVLDFLSGRYPSDDFAELRPRLQWDRVSGQLRPRKGAQRMAILNGGTIPDRGLYGVFLATEEKPVRVGELDEEMVFETRPGEVFLLGASSWRVVDITHDRVLVVPAPGEPGRMPFWRGEGPGRPAEFGKAIGALTQKIAETETDEIAAILVANHGLTSEAAQRAIEYVRSQQAATVEVPSDRTIVVESFTDEVGDWRVAMLTPFGSRIHAPWAILVLSELRKSLGEDVDMTWTDDGIMFRVPFKDGDAASEALFPDASTVETGLISEIGSTALFAAKFRENAARALLLPRQYPGKRTPLWVQRRKSAELLRVTAGYRNFPLIVETYRECLRDVFDVPGLREILSGIEKRAIRVHHVDTRSPSPFAAALMYNYTANFLYDQDAPLAERRARNLALDYRQLRELLGDAEIRSLLERDVIEQVELELQRIGVAYPASHPDAVHDLLLTLGDLSTQELQARVRDTEDGDTENLAAWLATLVDARRIITIKIGDSSRWIAAEDAGRYRDALGVMLPSGLPDAFIDPVDNPVRDLVSRYARTHIPFPLSALLKRLPLAETRATEALAQLVANDRLLEGEFLPDGTQREWCDKQVLQRLKQRSLAKVREQIAPVTEGALVTFLSGWQFLQHPKRGLDGLLDVLTQLQGVALSSLVWEQDVLPARVRDFHPAMLDELCGVGEILWRGHKASGPSDGKICFYLADQFALLAEASTALVGENYERIRESLRERGATFLESIDFGSLELQSQKREALWDLVWNGEVTNDRFASLRDWREKNKLKKRGQQRKTREFRSRRQARSIGVQGRWTLLDLQSPGMPSHTERESALAHQLLERYGVVTREAVGAEGIGGGFSRVYPVFKTMEESARVRRGYFIAGLGAAQFALPGAEDRLRDCEAKLLSDSKDKALFLATTDPANPFGAALPWPESDATLSRRAGTYVVLDRGCLAAYYRIKAKSVVTFGAAGDDNRQQVLKQIASALVEAARKRGKLSIFEIDGESPRRSPLCQYLLAGGFTADYRGLEFYARPSEGGAAGNVDQEEPSA